MGETTISESSEWVSRLAVASPALPCTMGQTIRFAVSTCPNDTFTFRALLEGLIDTRGLDLKIDLADVQELNERLAAGALDGGKVSFHAALKLADRYRALPVGAALGFGVGPVLLAAEEGRRPVANDRVLCPGEDTTATLLYRLYQGEGEVDQVVFDEIIPALQEGKADFGVCIHEGRFTYRERGLHLVEDLGQWWEEFSGGPVPLGGLIVRDDLDDEMVGRLTAVIRDSLDHAMAHREDCLPTMRHYAQELEDEVIWPHVDLYVNDWTRDLGEQGRVALKQLSAAADARGLLPGGIRELRVAD